MSIFFLLCAQDPDSHYISFKRSCPRSIAWAPVRRKLGYDLSRSVLNQLSIREEELQLDEQDLGLDMRTYWYDPGTPPKNGADIKDRASALDRSLLRRQLSWHSLVMWVPRSIAGEPFLFHSLPTVVWRRLSTVGWKREKWEFSGEPFLINQSLHSWCWTGLKIRKENMLTVTVSLS